MECLVSSILWSPSLWFSTSQTQHLSLAHCAPYAGLTSSESEISQAGGALDLAPPHQTAFILMKSIAISKIEELVQNVFLFSTTVVLGLWHPIGLNDKNPSLLKIQSCYQLCIEEAHCESFDNSECSAVIGQNWNENFDTVKEVLLSWTRVLDHC